MKVHLDPITGVLEKFAWVFWTILWVSLATGIGQDEIMFLSGGELELMEVTTIVVVIMMWSAVILQTIRQLFYSESGVLLVRFGRWLLLGASSIFAFRTTWMLITTGSEMHISPATLIGGGLLALGLCVNALGRMQEHYTFDTDAQEFKYVNKWTLGEHV
jgi:hypothetical protein